MQPCTELGPHLQHAPELKILQAKPSFCTGHCWYHTDRPRVNISWDQLYAPTQVHPFLFSSTLVAQVILCWYSLLSHHAATLKLHSLKQHLYSSSHRALVSGRRWDWPCRILFFIVMVYFKWNKLKNELCFAVEEVLHSLLKKWQQMLLNPCFIIFTK